MRRAKVFILGSSFILLLALTAGGVFRSDDDQTGHGARTHSSGQQSMLTRSMAKVNNVKIGEEIKHQLDTQEEVTLIFHNKKDTSHYYDHEATVDFVNEPSVEELDQITRDIKGWVIKHLNSIYIFRSTVMETPEMIDYFNQRKNIEYAEPNFILMQNEVNGPNDLLYQENYQWNLPVIGTEQGWKVTRGNEDIEIAIVDTGVDLDHPDLRNRLVKGYNVIDEKSEPDDDNGHGTHVAGIIASETDNNEGVAGMTWFSKIMPIKAMGAKGYGTTFDIAKGIVWAVDHGADVINLSLGNYQPSRVLEESVRYAYKKNVVMVSAAGNDGSDQPTYPSAYPEVLSVSAVDYNGNRASFSNFGDYIDIAAPGVYIPSTYFNQQYAALSGTSMAAPHVAGLAALIKSANPDLSSSQVIRIIKNSAIDLGEQGKDSNYGNGLIDVNSALQEAGREKPSLRKQEKSLFDWLR
ncbi:MULTISPECIES: S8 family peptidase [unclassified Bacillus (in: firmicutes)]|uniref:S8 family peptidase n=1 Tax=unclassified Bacillus (in: firmicutes) TaxID=185979 RepID=UPI001BE5BEF7|nr:MULTISPECIES: S8 family peptidase [unclassified Bacillus (in: firmicutes)]MBT2638036.1 peptidase S8 [Bacillus sp. ISL-39]MBT2661211.1 peptidase S8 [Bacillus sp. ISL-45]